MVVSQRYTQYILWHWCPLALKKQEVGGNAEASATKLKAPEKLTFRHKSAWVGLRKVLLTKATGLQISEAY